MQKLLNWSDTLNSYALGDFSLQKLTDNDLELVRTWRNSAPIKKLMFNETYISPKEQKKWFISSRGNRDDFIFCSNQEKIGLVYLYNKNPLHLHCEFGFYIGDEKYLSSGFGSVMEFMALELVFGDWGYNRVLCPVLEENKTVISQHLRFGFKQEGLFRSHIKKDRFINVIILGILKDEWRSCRDKIYKILLRIYGF